MFICIVFSFVNFYAAVESTAKFDFSIFEPHIKVAKIMYPGDRSTQYFIQYREKKHTVEMSYPECPLYLLITDYACTGCCSKIRHLEKRKKDNKNKSCKYRDTTIYLAKVSVFLLKFQRKLQSSKYELLQIVQTVKISEIFIV